MNSLSKTPTNKSGNYPSKDDKSMTKSYGFFNDYETKKLAQTPKSHSSKNFDIDTEI